jgi:flagellar protein FliO/FliZ
MTMASTDYVRFIAALAVVLALIGVCGWLAKRIRLNSTTGSAAGSQRLQVMESLPLDGRQRLVLIRLDDREHLLLLGQEQGLVVKADISHQTTIGHQTTIESAATSCPVCSRS